ncbi:MAG: uroporphyrinogen decarboxylase family protein, partial [Victivallales bacterium]
EWGNLWARIDPTSKGEVEKGAIENIEDISSFEFPDYSRPEDYSCVREARDKNPDKYFIGGVPGFTFNIARKLRKLEQYLMDILLEPEAISGLHDKVDVVIHAMIRNYAACGVDSIMFAEDWGTQNQTLLSPELWRKEFFPRTKSHCDLAHKMGIKVFMHSCGQIEAIVPGLIEAGIDVLQFDQPALHGIDVLASHQAMSKITFWCPVDIQKTLQTCDEMEIRKGAREMLDKLWKGRGGFIAGYYGDNESVGLDPKWQDFACDEFTKNGLRTRYAK